MTTSAERGFTIIEVMLFLAITGALFVALMVGVNAGITQQRYLDSARSYKALLQNEYSEAITTRNTDTKDWQCDTDITAGTAGSVSQQTNSRVAWGTSQCVILGRAIRIVNDGDVQKIVVSSVTGIDPIGSDDIKSSNDIAALNLYMPKLAIFDEQSQETDWGVSLTSIDEVNHTSTSDSTAVVLILRSPVSGTIRIFTSPIEISNSTDLRTLINEVNSTTILKNCIKGDSGLLPKQMVSINPKVSSADAITLDGGQNEVCQ